MDTRYRLAPMREARTHTEHARRGALAGAVGEVRTLAVEVDEATRRVDLTRAAIREATETRDRWLARGGPVGSIAHLDRYLHHLRRELEAAHGALVRAEAQHRGQLDVVELARRQLAHARAEREVIERHFAAWRAERHKRAERRDD